MTAETYLLFVAPLVLLAFGTTMYAVLAHLDRRPDVQLRPAKAARHTLNR